MSSETQKMRSNFGFVSGLATASTFLLPAIALAIVLKMDANFSLLLFIGFFITTRFFSEWLFWTQMFPLEVGDEERTTPVSIRAMFDMLVDLAVDAALIYMALKVASPAWIFFVFLGCQSLVAPIQGIIVDKRDPKSYRIFSMIITVLSLVISLQVTGIASPIYVHMLGLDHFSAPVQMLMIIGIKNLFSATMVISKASIARCIQTNMKKSYE